MHASKNKKEAKRTNHSLIALVMLFGCFVVLIIRLCSQYIRLLAVELPAIQLCHWLAAHVAITNNILTSLILHTVAIDIINFHRNSEAHFSFVMELYDMAIAI